MNFMIDIETTGLNAGTNYITSCAIVPFDLDFEGVYDKEFHERLHCPVGMRVRDSDTSEFRDKHGIGRAEAKLPCRAGMAETLMAMRNFMHDMVDDVNTIYVWAKPTNFDIAFLESYYRYADMHIPWHYRNVRDLGTYLDAAGHSLNDLYKEIKMSGDAHNALHDCYYQITIAQFGWRAIQEQRFALLSVLEKRKKLAG